MTHSKIILKINDANFQGICTSCCIVKDEQTLIALIYEPKTLSETMNEQSYYETMYILRPDIAEDEVTSHIDKYNKLLKDFGGTILDSQMRGKRRLAYQIAKHREGIYVQLSHQGDGQHIFKIEKAMRLSEDVIRYMTVKQEGPLPTPRPSTKNSTQVDDKENSEPKVESKEKQPVISADTSTSKKDDSETKDNAES
jgi:small subunit ribosomal protein S6|tara:strand:+ start:710 stop:1300 length:591 start_codon:yes stop_codon:yes gene_type:complete